MARALVVFIGGCFLLGACTQRSICPAFQSAYIYDKDALRKKFSYFQEDSTPKVLMASKNQYLVADPTPYRKKVRNLQTVEMKPVPVLVPDSLINEDSVSMQELNRAARSIIDSTFIEDRPAANEQVPVEDSVYVITKDRELRLLKYNGADSLVYDPATEKYVAQKPEYYVKDVRLNIEQDNYMWYLRDYLVLPDVRIARMQQGAEQTRAADQKKAKKKEKKGGFFKNLFRKKQKETDSTELAPPPKEEFDFIDADTLTQAQPRIEDSEAQKEYVSGRKKKSKDASVINTAALSPENKRKGTRLSDARKEEADTPVEGF
jgi:hypothetical protein